MTTDLAKTDPAVWLARLAGIDGRSLPMVILSWAGAFGMVLLAMVTFYMAQPRLPAPSMAPQQQTSIVVPHKLNAQAELVDIGQERDWLDPLTHAYPHIGITVQSPYLVITATVGDQFREWLTALEFIDAYAPQWRWSLHDFCVGQCPGGSLMRAVLQADRVDIQ